MLIALYAKDKPGALQVRKDMLAIAFYRLVLAAAAPVINSA